MGSRYNEILVGRFARGVQKLFGVKGEVPVGSLGGELQVIHSLMSGAENRYLEGWDLFAISQAPTGGAAQNAAVRLRNPKGSNVLVVVQMLLLGGSPVVSNISVAQSQGDVDLTTVASVTNARLDSRGRPQPSSIVSSTTNFGALPTVQPFFVTVAANGASVHLVTDAVQEIPLLPGNSLDIIDNVQAQTFAVSLMWRERFLEESERT